mmetsp:Transcript_93668/g.200944  ORF Transcript_93668/g.200944 Transcript_93668/m.200944 type:complete len:1192 (+) Transcript_93668:79-3654(+)
MADAVVAQEEEEWPEPKELEGQLVEIYDLQGKTVKALSVQEEEAETQEVDLEGEQGRVVSWFEPEQKYIVETFSGILAGVPEANVKEWTPAAPEEGGFDLAWPAGAEATAYFGDAVTERLIEKGFCLIQTFMSEKEREEALVTAEPDRKFDRMKQEVESAYMGYENNTKVATMGYDDPDQDAVGALETSNRQMTTLSLLLAPIAPSQLGFSVHGMVNSMIRMSIDKNEEDELPQESLQELDESADGGWTGFVEEFVRFSQRRRVSMINMIANDGGDIWLYPKDKTLGKPVHIPITQNKLLVFRHDLMDYSYQVQGRSVALQTWILDDVVKYQQIKEMAVVFPVPGLGGEVVVNPGPEVPDGPKASIMALTTRLPGEVWNPTQYWNMFSQGTDTISQWPYNRWDTEPYYYPDVDSNLTGKSYTCHGGFVSNEQITQFDNNFFGIPHAEAQCWIPSQKMSLEVGYQCLVASGFNKKTLSGRRMGVWFGDVGPDWDSFQTEWGKFHLEASPTQMCTSLHRAVTSGRIAHLYDLKGPVSSYDTACSASLVAMNAAHLLMFDSDPPKPDNAEALVQGVNTLLGPGSFIGNCMATMLSHQGRSFTFNRSADGYQRGEGAGAVFIKLFLGDKREEEERVCALIGTATNQDGRSASLTAPNGPAQQQVIKKSMRFAGINPNTVSIAECHGTGTALGDPIEVGALMAVMHKREFPLLKTSAKSAIAHLEAGAGMAGITKCIMMINVASAPPNCHFNIINPHLTTEGYPTYFDTEVIDTGFSSLYCGVSSFGFGGTNSRADVYGYASKGHKAVIKYELPKLTPPRIQHMGQTVYIRGTWSNWTTYEEMDGGQYGEYVVSVVLGDTRQESFQLSCDQDGLEVIHPLVPDAGTEDQIVGPDWEYEGLNFMIDGRKDGKPPGTVYEITFTWTDEKKTISWKASDDALEDLVEDSKVLGYEFKHEYYILGSWKSFDIFQKMKTDADGNFVASFQIGFTNTEEFQIVRNADMKQLIYPPQSKAPKANLPACGPDAGGKGAFPGQGKNFMVKGPQYQTVEVMLSIEDGKYTVTASSLALGTKTWMSWEGWAAQSSLEFSAITYSEYDETERIVAMVPDTTTPGVHSGVVTLDGAGWMSLQIMCNGDKSLMLYPDDNGALTGPSSEGKTPFWIEGMPLDAYEVTLDLNEPDRKKMLTWKPARIGAIEG